MAANAEGSWEPPLSRRLWLVENWQVIPLPTHRGSCLWLWPSCPCSRAVPTPGEGNRVRTDRGEVTTSSLREALCEGGALAVLKAKSQAVIHHRRQDRTEAYNYSDLICGLFYKGPRGPTSVMWGGILKAPPRRVGQTHPHPQDHLVTLHSCT